MHSLTAAKLQRILARAAIAPGNRDRFLSAGLVIPQPATGQFPLAADWPTAFARLPILTQETVRTNPGLFLAGVEHCAYRGVTSGSQGNHLIYFADTLWNQTRLTQLAAFLQGWGIDDRVAIVNVASRLFPLRPQDTTLLGAIAPPLLETLLMQLSYPPVAIRGYPSRLCEVAARLLGKPIPPVVAVICTGESLFEFQKQLLEQVFAAPVVNEYGCQESGISGFTCPEAGRLHLDDTRCVYEVIDGQLVTTDLWNVVMPMVRYQCGDMVQLDAHPCDCGRPQPTAKILGRQVDGIYTPQGRQLPGALMLPAFEGILHYQVMQEDAHHLTLRVYPDAHDRPLSFDAMATWVTATFGEVAVQVLLEQSPDPVPASVLTVCNPDVWIHGITQGNWTEWLQSGPLPAGELQVVAQLLQAIVTPIVISYDKNSMVVQQYLQAVLTLPIQTSPMIERIIIRTLFFASSCLAQQPGAIAIYQQARERLYQLFEKTSDCSHPAILDAFIATLALPWDDVPTRWQALLQRGLGQTSAIPDTFTLQHLIHAFEPAVQRANAVKISPLVPSCTPVLAVLLGDLATLGQQVNLAWVAHWFEVLSGRSPMADPCVLGQDAFCDRWLQWRQHLIRQPQTCDQAWQQFSQMARSPQQQARVLLEQGYHHLLAAQPLPPAIWLPQLESALQAQLISPVSVAPLWRSLAQTLIEQQQHPLAYDCLLASVVPSSASARFEQLAHPENRKQAVLLNLDG